MVNLLIGPFTQVATCADLPKKGPLKDSDIHYIPNAGILVDHGRIVQLGPFKSLLQEADKVEEIPYPAVALPGFIDAHTHICFSGSRVNDFADRLQGISYQKIASRGGGILETVRKTREATEIDLVQMMLPRLEKMLSQGITTAEVKSGYALNVEGELKMLRAILAAKNQQAIDLIPTCLAAHALPPEYSSRGEYLTMLEEKLLPKARKLTRRVDIFIEKEAFQEKEALNYLKAAKKLGFDLIVHGDQFSRAGSKLAASIQAFSCDHLEVSTDSDFKELDASGVIPIMLPGASLGLGLPFPPARKALDAGLPLVIASDWNPGSAPFGYLLAVASFLAASEKLTIAEVLAAITCRAALALNLPDRGFLAPGMRADILAFRCSDFREIVYWQGGLQPFGMWIHGKTIFFS